VNKLVSNSNCNILTVLSVHVRMENENQWGKWLNGEWLLKAYVCVCDLVIKMIDCHPKLLQETSILKNSRPAQKKSSALDWL